VVLSRNSDSNRSGYGRGGGGYNPEESLYDALNDSSFNGDDDGDNGGDGNGAGGGGGAGANDVLYSSRVHFDSGTVGGGGAGAGLRTPPRNNSNPRRGSNHATRARSNSETDLMYELPLVDDDGGGSGGGRGSNSSNGSGGGGNNSKRMSPVVAKTAARRHEEESDMVQLRQDVDKALRRLSSGSGIVGDKSGADGGGNGTVALLDGEMSGAAGSLDYGGGFLDDTEYDDEDDEDEDDEEDDDHEGSAAAAARWREGGNENVHGERIHVVVRKRPVKEGQTDVLECEGPALFLHEPKKKVDLTEYMHSHKFRYDNVFSELDTTTDLYRGSVHSLVHNLFQGGTSTCFCFGQTASGKTFTLFGQCGGGEDPVGVEGLYVIAARRIFDTVRELCEEGFEMAVGVAMFEIYGQKVFDLLDEHKSLQALEDKNGVLQLVGLSRHRCADFGEFMTVTDSGRDARSTTATGANATSSRSHCVMAISLLDESDGPGQQITYTPKNASDVVGKLSLIDLAGSERGVDNGNTDKTTRREGKDINTSLLALKEVIRALDGKSRRAPFRQSRLTQVLQESLTGEMCQTVVVACVSATLENCQQTLNTLRYAEGLKRSQTAVKEKVGCFCAVGSLVKNIHPHISRFSPFHPTSLFLRRTAF
jgi:hypothetical protein